MTKELAIVSGKGGTGADAGAVGRGNRCALSLGYSANPGRPRTAKAAGILNEKMSKVGGRLRQVRRA